MIKHLKKQLKKGVYVYISLFALSIISCNQIKKDTKEVHLNIGQKLQKNYTAKLITCQSHLDSLSKSNSKKDFEKYYLNARKVFKQVEPMMAFVDAENYKFLNAPNILKVEEEDATNIKVMSPKSFQVLEESIYTEETLDIKKVQETAKLIYHRLKLIEKNTKIEYFKEHHVLWLLRDAILRVSQTGITGFDSPVLEQSLAEAQEVYNTLNDYIHILETEFVNKELYNSWVSEIESTIKSLDTKNFNSFNRYNFIKNHTHKQLRLFNETVLDWNTKFPFTLALKNDAPSLFSDKTFNTEYYSDIKNKGFSKEVIALGRDLFNDKSLSINNSMSCATCHNKEKAFTDGFKKPKGQLRNSPTLTYASLQQSFFYDNRAGSLEGQIVSVVNNETEFHTNLETLQKAVNTSPDYKSRFDSIYNGKVTDYNIRNAIAEYIRTLNKFNSKFDKNINGLENTLTKKEINGFNLFMGKAKCATCHFAPVFNGTVPTLYKDTEIELLGVPTKNDTINAIVDTDLGRYNVFKTEERKHFFKTPTVRNIELTAPYMHNGVYTTLEEVVDFYNRGGGAGIGIDLELQTLPPTPLNLSEIEKEDLILFMKSLTDSTKENI